MKKDKVQKIGYFIGYVGGIIIFSCIIMVIVAFAIGIVRNIL